LVRVMIEQESTDELLIKVVISDTGLGLNKAQQEKLFQSFTQADSSTTRKYGGTGLGLAICKKLVTKMGGSIGIDSVLGQGSDFWFTLKLKIAIGKSKINPPQNWQQREAYIFDPHKIANLVTCHHLQEWGFNTKSSEQFEDYLTSLNTISTSDEMLSSEQIPLLIVSCKYADNTLEKLTDWMQQKINFQGKIIALCSSNEQNEQNRLLSYPISNVITKPLITSKFYGAIEQIFPQQITPEVEESSTLMSKPSLTNQLKILVVDDNEANVMLLCALMEDLSISPVSAINGFEAVELAQKQSFDIIFMDIQMPGMDGIEATRKIRANSMNKQTPIIAVTAHAMKGEKQALMTAGMDDYLSKPIDENQLISCLQHWTSDRLLSKTSDLTLSTEETSVGNHSSQQDEIVDDSSALSASSPPTPISWEKCLTLANGKKDLALDMLSMLIKSIPDTRDKLEKHRQSKAVTELVQEVHKFHGATCYTGVVTLKQYCLQLEKELKSNAFSEKAKQDYTKLLVEMALVEQDFERISIALTPKTIG